MGEDSNSEKEKKKTVSAKPTAKKAKGKTSFDREIEELTKLRKELLLQESPYEGLRRKTVHLNKIEEQALREKNTFNNLPSLEGLNKHLSWQLEAQKSVEGSIHAFRDTDSYIQMRESLLSLTTLVGTRETSFMREMAEYINARNSFKADLYNQYNNNELIRIFEKSKEVIEFAATNIDTRWLQQIKTDPFRNLFGKINLAWTDFRELVEVTAEMNRIYAGLPPGEVVVVNNETVLCGGRTHGISEIIRFFRRWLDKAGFLSGGSIGKKQFYALLSIMKKAVDYSRKKIISPIIITLFAATIYDVFIDPYVEAMKHSFYQEDEVVISEPVERGVQGTSSDRRNRADLMFVAVDNLNVRREASISSDIIGELHSGDVLTIIKKEQGWSLVKWKDRDSDSEIQGWVANGYLEEIKM